MTEAEQLDIIWWALASARFWISVNADGSMVLQENTAGQNGRTLHQFKGTREEIAQQLIALRVGDRLDGISHDLMEAASGTVRDRMKAIFKG